MDTAERIATSEPLNARMLGLNAINKVDPDCQEKYDALNLPIPAVRSFSVFLSFEIQKAFVDF